MQKENKVEKGVIVAAGLGTRFLPITKSVPKEMLPVLEKPVLQYVVEEMVESGIKDITIVISREKTAIKNYFKRDLEFEKKLKKAGKFSRLEPLVKILKETKINFVYQDEALGNGHALLCAKRKIGQSVFAFSDADSIIDAEIPVTRQMINIYQKFKSPVIGVQKIRDKVAMTKYGNVYGQKTRDKHVFTVEKFIEKPSEKNVSPHGLIVGGMRYVFTSDIWEYLERQGQGKGGEIWVADAANELAHARPFYAVKYDGKYFDTGNEEALLKTTKYFYDKRK